MTGTGGHLGDTMLIKEVSLSMGIAAVLSGRPRCEQPISLLGPSVPRADGDVLKVPWCWSGLQGPTLHLVGSRRAAPMGGRMHLGLAGGSGPSPAATP